MERAIGVLGIVVLLLLAWLASTNRRAIAWGTVSIALALQAVIALIALRTAAGAWFFDLATPRPCGFG